MKLDRKENVRRLKNETGFIREDNEENMSKHFLTERKM